MADVTPINGDKGHVLSMHEIRIILSDQIRDLASQTTSPAHANAVSNSVGKVLSTLKLEMEYRRLMGRKGEIPMLESGLAEDAEEDGRAAG